MKQNRSLAISAEIQKINTVNKIGLLESVFPNHIFEKEIFQTKNEKKIIPRNRVFNFKNTLLAMTYTAAQEDKSLKNSVSLYYTLHQNDKKSTTELLEKEMEKAREEYELLPKTAGRPKIFKAKITKSLEKDISINTAAFSNARGRLPMELVDDLFNESLIKEAKNDYSHWHEMLVFIGDGTYAQMQDMPSIRENFEVLHNGKPSEQFPQCLIEVLISRGTGQIFKYSVSNRHISELRLFYDLMDEIPPNSILLLDDLYNCYEILAKAKRLNIQIVVPAKRDRNTALVKKIATGDEIVTIKKPKKRSKWLDINEEADSIDVRIIDCKSPDGKDYKILTTVLNEAINKEEFQIFYLTRWDVEVGIREIKTIMDINILRSKTPEMALKELKIALATYNLLRKVIYVSVKGLPFSPKGDFIYELYKNNKSIHLDKKGRVYNRWSTGRKRANAVDNKRENT